MFSKQIIIYKILSSFHRNHWLVILLLLLRFICLFRKQYAKSLPLLVWCLPTLYDSYPWRYCYEPFRGKWDTKMVL